MIIVCEQLLVKVGRKNMKRPPTGQMSVERESSVNNDLTLVFSPCLPESVGEPVGLMSPRGFLNPAVCL